MMSAIKMACRMARKHVTLSTKTIQKTEPGFGLTDERSVARNEANGIIAAKPLPCNMK